jgi:hypothetical protein
VEAEFVSGYSTDNDLQEATPAVIERLKTRMPELIKVFRNVVARGVSGE